MTAYLVIEVEVTDPAAYEAYRQQMPGAIAKYDGRPLARGFTELLEGTSSLDRMSIIEFPDEAAARRFFEADEVRALSALRCASSHSTAKLIVPR